MQINLATCYVIAYDIPDDKRRTKVHQILMGFGKWTTIGGLSPQEAILFVV